MADQASQLARLRTAYAGNRAHAESLRATLSAAQLAWLPPGGGWSVAQVYEHLVLAHASYRETLHALLDRAAAAVAPGATVMPPAAAWRPSLVGGWLARSLEKPGRLPAPGIYRPGPTPRADVLGAYLAALDTTGALLERSVGLEWQRLRLASPVSPLFRMNAGDAFTVMANHDTRHRAQVERVLRHPAFPASR